MKNYNKFHRHILSFILLLLLFLIPAGAIEAASSLKLYYDKKNVTYTNKQVIYKLGSKTLSNKKYPGIIISGTSLAAAKDVFTNKSIGATYNYTSKSGKIILKKDYTTVEMTLGSNKAIVDGKTQTMSIAPKKVTYKSTGVTKIMVPARFVFEAFGYSYSWNSTASAATVKASSVKPLNIKYDNVWQTYRGTQGKVTFDGKSINVSSMPSIIIDSTTLVQAKKVFSSSNIDAEYNYNKSKEQLILTKDETIVALTVGSNIALVNGEEKKMSTEVRIVKNKSNGYSYIMVPANNVAVYLGYNYSWNSSTKTSVITTKKVLTPPPTGNTTGGNTGSNTGGTKNSYLNFQLLDTYKNEYAQIERIVNSDIKGESQNISNIQTVSEDPNTYPNKEVYKITLDQPVQNLSSSYKDDRTILVTTKNTYAEGKTYSFNNDLVSQVSYSQTLPEYETNFEFTLNAPKMKYEVSLSEDKKTILVSVYYNYINQLDVSYESYQDKLLLNGLYVPNAHISETSDSITITLPNTINSIGNQKETLDNGFCIKMLEVQGNNDKTTTIKIEKTESSEYYTSISGNSFSIVLTDEPGEEEEDIDLPSSLDIKKPSDVSFPSITDQDLYHSKKIILTIPGDYVDYYSQNPIITGNPVVSNVNVTLNSSYNTDIIITTNKIQGYRLIDKGDYITVHLDNPQNIYKNIVVLDAGHGGTDPGASRSKINEKDLNFAIMNQYAPSYFNSQDSEIKAYWTRITDVKIDLYERAAFAKEVGADLFVSMHMNAATNTSAGGTEVYYSTVNTSTLNGLSSSKLAQIVCNNLSSGLGSQNRGAKNMGVVVCKYNTVPAILVELGFMSNSSDLKKISNGTYQDNTARILYNSLVQVFNTYPTGR